MFKAEPCMDQLLGTTKSWIDPDTQMISKSLKCCDLNAFNECVKKMVKKYCKSSLNEAVQKYSKNLFVKLNFKCINNNELNCVGKFGYQCDSPIV